MKTGRELIKSINEIETAWGTSAFWWLGQLGYVLKFGKTVVYIDPFLSPGKNRNIPPLLSPEDITNADFIIGTHDHTDHIDRKVWYQLSVSSPQAKFIVPGLLVDGLSNDLGIPGDRFIAAEDSCAILQKDLKITGAAAAHEFLDCSPQTGQYPYMGYVIEGNGTVVYHSGDCCIYEGLLTKLRSWKRFDAAFLPINGRDAVRFQRNCIGNMTYQEAVDLAGNLKVGLAVPGHYEMFSANSENPHLFKDYLNVKYPDIKVWIGEHGEPVIIQGKV